MKRIGLILTLLLPLVASAQPWKTVPVIAMDAQFGGDTLGTVYYTDGTDQDIKAGNGIVFNGGALIDLPMDGLQARATIGFKYSTSAASNIDIAKTAWPLEAGVRYHFGDGFFAEGGLVQHLAAKLKVDDDETEFDSSVGLNLKAGWRFITVGYSQQTYATDSDEYDASSVNIGLELPLDF